MSDQGLARSRLPFGPRTWLYLLAAAPALATADWLLQHTPKSSADSAFSIAVTDVAREKLAGMARYKVQVIPKPKLCEALKASDYPCDVLLDETQANQLGRFLSVNAYTIGTLERSGGTITATIRVRDIGSSGMAAPFTLSSRHPRTR